MFILEGSQMNPGGSFRGFGNHAHLFADIWYLAPSFFHKYGTPVMNVENDISFIAITK